MPIKATITSQHNKIEKVKKNLFYISAIVIFIAELLDPFLIGPSNSIFYINITIATIMALVIVLYYYGILNVINATGIVIYFILSDLLISPFFRIDSPDIGLFYLRLSLVVFAIIPYAGFAIHKRHIIIIGILYLIDYILIAVLSNHEFLLKGMAIVIMTLSAFVVGTYFLISSLMRALGIQKELLNEADKINKELRSRKNELKQTIESKNKLFSIISHDLKSPFNSILGFADLGIKDLKNNRPKNFEKYFRIIKQSAQQSYLLLLNLLDWSSSERGDLHFSPESINVKNLFKDIRGFLQHEADKKELTIQLDIEDKLSVYADMNMLTSIIRNLLTNAIKFSSIKEDVILSGNEYNNGTLLQVSDNGIGLSENKLKHFFSQKRQKPGVGTNNEKGSGLGLLICKDFVKIHKGKIWAKNNIGSGLSVFIFFPGLNK